MVSHREQLRKWWVLALLGFIGFSLIWTIGFFALFFSRQSADAQLVAGRASDLSALQVPSSALPQALETSDVTVIQRSSTSVDLVDFLTNPNTAWGAAEVTYHFTVNGQDQPSNTTFVNIATQDRPLIASNVPLEKSQGATASLTIDEVNWQRVAAAALPKPAFAVESIQLSSTNVTLSGQTFLTINVQAKVTNRSVYNFLRVTVPIVLKQSGKIVAVDELPLDRWPTLSQKTINHTWAYPVGAATEAVILPQASQFDATNLYQ